MSAQRNTNPEVTMFTIKANRSTVHIAGIEERTPAQHDSEEAASARGYVAYYAESACGGLTRSGHRMETLGEYADIEAALNAAEVATRSEEHTSELQSLMRISYAVFCLKKKKTDTNIPHVQIYQ